MQSKLGSFQFYALAISIAPLFISLLIWLSFAFHTHREKRSFAEIQRNIRQKQSSEMPSTEGDLEFTLVYSEKAAFGGATSNNEEGDEIQEHRTRVQRIFNDHVHALLLVVWCVYPAVSAVHFRSLVCTSFEDGSRYLRVDTTIDCDSAHYSQFIAAIIPLLLIYQLLPLLLFALLWRIRRKLVTHIAEPNAAFSFRLSNRQDPDVAPYW